MPAPTFIVEYTDGSNETIKLLPKAQLAYEREKKRSLRDDVASLTEMYELAWYAAGKPDDSLVAWIERVESVEPEGDEEDDANRPTSPSKSHD